MNMYEFEQAARREGYAAVCGVDEAGRGPLAGDVYAAAVILPPGLELAGVNDSKKLSEKRREALYGVITEQAAAWCVASASVEEIERLNILQASLLAMRRAVEGLGVRADFALVDGNRDPHFEGVPCKTIVGGDGKSASVAAASILAKVTRDRYMEQLAARHPQYGFERHKGYGTKAHREALLKYGPCPAHRKLFLRRLGL